MIQRRPTRLSEREFHEEITETLYALVYIDGSPMPRFHPGVSEFFHSAYPKLFTIGFLPGTAARDERWWNAEFQTSVGPIRGDQRRGYYLFEGGVVIGHHNGQTSQAAAAWNEISPEMEKRIQVYAFRGARVPPMDLEAARQIIGYLDEIVDSKQQSSGWGSDSDVDPIIAPPSPTVAAGLDPFVILGIPHDASDDDIKAAYKNHMKLNHPDKVTHMSQAIQDFAKAQVVSIKSAYDRITQVRKGRG